MQEEDLCYEKMQEVDLCHDKKRVYKPYKGAWAKTMASTYRNIYNDAVDSAMLHRFPVLRKAKDSGKDVRTRIYDPNNQSPYINEYGEGEMKFRPNIIAGSSEVVSASNGVIENRDDHSSKSDEILAELEQRASQRT
jgi:hypothetical protein